ncbi:MAG: 8-oxo-dGTP diphosphatase [Frankiaceae bacterium]|jgi:8-oxo-dGTP pyrophosphatase MutT (NUDIX family)|nr:8-oxo-dGTP diphosphatase [Frankiaceae bacterium]
MAVFRRLPGPMRRAVVHAATPSFTAGAVAVLRRDDGRIAFVEQRHTPGWGLPGGLMERGESPEQCLLRELVEELGVVVDPASLPLPFAAVNAGVRRVDVVYFIDAPPGVRLRTEDEIEVSRTGWFSLDALPELNEPTVDILRAVRVL